jgi:hypothetical protein
MALKVKPRELKFLGPKSRIKTAWLFNKSIFRYYREDRIDVLNKCFDFDWEFVKEKFEYLIKDSGDREKVKDFIKSNYKILRDGYKLTAGQDSNGNIMSIGKGMFSQTIS